MELVAIIEVTPNDQNIVAIITTEAFSNKEYVTNLFGYFDSYNYEDLYNMLETVSSTQPNFSVRAEYYTLGELNAKSYYN